MEQFKSIVGKVWKSFEVDYVVEFVLKMGCLSLRWKNR